MWELKREVEAVGGFETLPLCAFSPLAGVGKNQSIPKKSFKIA
jgi:hypothetical protein